MSVRWKFSNASPSGVTGEPGDHPIIVEHVDVWEDMAPDTSETEVEITARFIEVDDVKSDDDDDDDNRLVGLLPIHGRRRARVIARTYTQVAFELSDEELREVRDWVRTLQVVRLDDDEKRVPRLVPREGDPLPDVVAGLLYEVSR